MVSLTCPNGQLTTGLCPSELLAYRFGRLRPVAALPVPDTDKQAHRYVRATTMAAFLLDRLGPPSAVVEEGGEGLPSSLMVTHDSGRHWHVLDDPCEGLAPSGLVAPSAGHWLLVCQLPGGMGQGNVRLYSSANSGKRWRLLDAANEEHTSGGNLGDGTEYDLAVSGNGRVVWVLDVVGGVGASTDWGRHWKWATIQPQVSDGEPGIGGAGGSQVGLGGLIRHEERDRLDQARAEPRKPPSWALNKAIVLYLQTISWRAQTVDRRHWRTEAAMTRWVPIGTLWFRGCRPA